MRTAMYLRKSRQDEEIINATIEETLAKHEMQLRAFAERSDIHIDSVYKEVASASDIDGRPVFNQLLLDIEQGLFDSVLVVSIDRLTRGNALDLERIKNTFSIMNCRIITPQKVYDPTNDDDEFFLDFNMFISARELKLIRNRMLKGRKTATEQGLYTGSVIPFGYTKVKNENGKGYILYPDEREAPIVQYIFEKFAEGQRPAEIMHYLNNNGLLTKRHKAWTHARLKRLLKNEVYIGYLALDRKQVVKTIENGVVKKKLAMNPNMRLVKGKHEPIIQMKTWEAVQNRIKINYVDMSNVHKSLVNPLAGIVFCEHCGKTMRRMPSKSWYNIEYFACPTLRCPTSSSELQLVEKRILSELESELKNFNVYLDNYAEEYEIRKANKEAEIKVLENSLAKRHKMYSKACEMLEEGIYTTEMFKARQSEINSQIEHIKQSIQELKERDDHDEVEVIRRLVPNIERCLKEYYSLDVKGKNQLLKSIIEKVTYSRSFRALRNTSKEDFELIIKLRF